MNESFEPGLVTIVVASYNHAEYLAARIESLIAQTYPDIEILVIDDCSPDNSVEVLRNYEAHPKVRLVIREKNGGWVAVSNQGIELSRGEFVLFGNCDDYCDPRMIAQLVASLQANPSAGIAFCKSQMVDEKDQFLGTDFDGREPGFQKFCAQDVLIPRKRMAKFLFHSCVIPNLSAALFRKEAFAKSGVLSGAYRVCSDWDLFFRVVMHYDVAYVSDPLNMFRQHATTIRSATKERVVFEEYFRLLLGEVGNFGFSLLERYQMRGEAMRIWCAYLLSPAQGSLENFTYHFGRIFKLDPFALVALPQAILLRILSIVKRRL